MNEKILTGKSLGETFPLSKAKPLKDGQKLYLPTIRVVEVDEKRNIVYVTDIGETPQPYYRIPLWFAQKLARMSENPNAPSKYIKIIRGVKSTGNRMITTINAIYCDVEGNPIEPNKT